MGNVKNVKAKRKRESVSKKGRNSTSEETDSEQMKEGEEEHKVIIRLEHEGVSFREWNPVFLTKAKKRVMGEVRSAKVLRSGALLVGCRDSSQGGKAIRVDKIGGKRVQVTLAKGGGSLVRGVIYGVPLTVSIEQIKDNITGAKVKEAV